MEAGARADPTETSVDSACWKNYWAAAREEAAGRLQWLLAAALVLVVIFTAFDLGLDPIGQPVRLTRILINGSTFLALSLILESLRHPWGQRHVFALMLALCEGVLIAQAHSLGHVSPAPARLAFHYVSALGLTVVAIQWAWPWQLALGASAAGAYAVSVPSSYADYHFFSIALSGWALLSTAAAYVFTRWRYRQFLTDEHLRQARAIAAQRAEQLAAKNAEMTEFFSVLSHDLRSPLINLEGFARELESAVESADHLMREALAKRNGRRNELEEQWGRVRADILECTDFIRRSVTKMGVLVNGILELSRIDTRPQRAERVDLNELVREVVDAMHYQIAEKNIRVSVARLPDVTGDRMRLGQIFGNLIDNAVKYMKPCGGQVEIGCLDARKDAFVFFVRDDGVGIRPEDHEKIFRLFARVNQGGVAGEGLGRQADRGTQRGGDLGRVHSGARQHVLVHVAPQPRGAPRQPRTVRGAVSPPRAKERRFAKVSRRRARGSGPVFDPERQLGIDGDFSHETHREKPFSSPVAQEKRADSRKLVWGKNATAVSQQAAKCSCGQQRDVSVRLLRALVQDSQPPRIDAARGIFQRPAELPGTHRVEREGEKFPIERSEDILGVYGDLRFAENPAGADELATRWFIDRGPRLAQ